jgi:hypothetical protein
LIGWAKRASQSQENQTALIGIIKRGRWTRLPAWGEVDFRSIYLFGEFLVTWLAVLTYITRNAYS